MIKVIIADDHPLIREAVKSLFSDSGDIMLEDSVDNGNDLIKKIREKSYDVVIADLSMPGKNGIDLIKQIKQESPHLPLLILSSYKENIFAVRAIQAGASGYLCKDSVVQNLLDAIRKIADKRRYITPEIAELLAQKMDASTQVEESHILLSNREHQIFLLLANGHSVSTIAEKLNLSIKTVSTHKTRIQTKIGVENTAGLVRYALTHNCISETSDLIDGN